MSACCEATRRLETASCDVVKSCSGATQKQRWRAVPHEIVKTCQGAIWSAQSMQTEVHCRPSKALSVSRQPCLRRGRASSKLAEL